MSLSRLIETWSILKSQLASRGSGGWESWSLTVTSGGGGASMYLLLGASTPGAIQ